MEFHDILELNGSSLLENYKEESFLIAYEICFNVFGAVSQIETKLEIIDRLRIWKENGETATHAQGLLDREKNLFKKLTDTYSFGSSGAVGLLHEVLKNSNDAQSIYQLIQIKKQRVQELKNTLEKLSHTSPEQIRLRWIEQKEREARQKVEMRRVSYLSKWQKNYLIANLSADLTRTQKQYLEDLFSICVDIFITKEVFYNSQKISEKASEMWQDKNGESLGHLLIGPKPFSELISLFWWLGNPGSIPKDAYDFISLKRPIIFSEIFWIFERFAMNKEEALFLASHFPISEDLNEVNQTEEKEAFLAVVSKTLAESELDERSRSRFESIRNQNSSLKYESLSSAHLLELAKNPDLLNPSIPVHELFRRNIPNEEVKKELKSDFNNKHVVALIDEALARNGDKEALKRILKTRISISQKKRLNRISPESMAEIVQLCFGENTDSEYLKIAQAELEMHKCPNLLLETFGTSKVNFKEHVIVGQILIEAGFGTRFVQNLEQRSDLMENEDLQKLYLSTAIKCEMPPKALNRSTHLQGDVFKEVLLLFLNRGSSEDLNLFCSRNREKMELAFQDASIRETLKTVSNETAFTLNVKLELDYPELHYKAARYAKSAYPDEFENQLGRLRAEYVSSGDTRIPQQIADLVSTLEAETDQVLEELQQSPFSDVSSRASAELGLRKYLKDEVESAIDLVKPHAAYNLECAHLMRQMDPDNTEWLHAMKNLIDENSIKVLQIRWENIPGRKMMPELETDDPELHINLIIKELKKVVRNKKSNRFKVQETWFCLLQANKPLESCSVHDSQTRHGVSHDLGEFRKENFVTFSWKRNGKLISPILNNRSNHRWQEESIDAWVSHGRVGIIQAVTGSGKSRVGTLAVAEALEDGYAVLLVVPTRVLADQWITDNLESFWEQGKLNRIGNTTTELDVPEARTAISGTLTVAVKSASAVDAVDQWISQAPRGTKMMILADEVHHLNGGMYTKFLRPEFDRRLGLTATLLPYEYDESKLKNFFMGDPIYDYDFNSAKRDNVITQYDLVMLGVNISEESQTIYQELEFEWRKSRDRLLTVTGKKIEASRLLEFGKNLLENEKFANDAKRFVDSHYALDDFINENALKSSTKAMGLISPLIKKYGRTALFCDFRDSAENVRQILSHRGVNAAIMTGSTDFGDREKLFKQLDAGDGELHAIAAPRVLDEGVDIQRLTIGCFVGRIRNRRMLIQRLGRVLRRHREKEKAFAIIIYIIGTEDDPDFQNRANERLVFSEFDFVGRNASQIRHFRVGEDDAELNQYLATL